MRTRDHYFKREATVANSDTVIIDLNIREPISFLSVEYEATNGATSCIDIEPHDDVDKIEIVDGSDVLWSLSGVETLAANWFEMGQMPHAKLSEDAAAVQEESFYLNFGRFHNDPEFYFDPTRFRNPQLRLTHSLAISATAGFATGTGKVTVMARVIEEGASPYRGFLGWKEKYSWTSAASGDELIELPRDLPYRLAVVKALLTTYRPDEVISKLKLSCDADKFRPFDTYTEDLMDLNERMWGKAQQDKTILSADDGTALLDLYDIRKGTVYSTYDDQIATVEALDAEQVSVGLYNMATPTSPALQATARALKLWVEGICPSGCVALPFGDPMIPESWFDPTPFGTVELYATQAAAGACAVMLQQLRV